MERVREEIHASIARREFRQASRRAAWRVLQIVACIDARHREHRRTSGAGFALSPLEIPARGGWRWQTVIAELRSSVNRHPRRSRVGENAVPRKPCRYGKPRRSGLCLFPGSIRYASCSVVLLALRPQNRRYTTTASRVLKSRRTPARNTRDRWQDLNALPTGTRPAATVQLQPERAIQSQTEENGRVVSWSAM